MRLYVDVDDDDEEDDDEEDELDDDADDDDDDAYDELDTAESVASWDPLAGSCIFV